MTKEEKKENEITYDTCLGCIYKDLPAYSYPCLSCKRIHECQGEDFYKDEEE